MPTILSRKIERELMAELSADAPVRDGEGELPIHDRRMVEQAAIAIAAVQRVMAYLDENGDVDRKGNLRPEVEMLSRANEGAMRALDRLGMSPVSRARLGLDLARGGRELSATAELLEGRRIREAAHARMAEAEMLGGEGVDE